MTETERVLLNAHRIKIKPLAEQVKDKKTNGIVIIIIRKKTATFTQCLLYIRHSSQTFTYFNSIIVPTYEDWKTRQFKQQVLKCKEGSENFEQRRD